MAPNATKSGKKLTLAAASKADANAVSGEPASSQEKNAGASKPGTANASVARFKSKARIAAEKKQAGKRTSAKLKQLLPEELYQVHIEFPADAPTRVVVRLERLMGSDRVRLTDTKYMCALLDKISQEEEKTLLGRTKFRKKEEGERYKGLAVEGLVEPGEDMEDIKDHPVFRMNKILNRLTKMGEELSRMSTKKFPPITPIEPFSSGGAPNFNPAADTNLLSCEDWLQEEEGEEETVDFMPFKKPPGRRHLDEEDNEEEEEEEEGDEEEEGSYDGDALEEIKVEDTVQSEWGGEDYIPDRSGTLLAEEKKRYGIPDDVNLEHKCKPYRSKLVDMVYEDQSQEGGVTELFDFATELLDAYKREGLTADDFVVKLNRMSK